MTANCPERICQRRVIGVASAVATALCALWIGVYGTAAGGRAGIARSAVPKFTASRLSAAGAGSASTDGPAWPVHRRTATSSAVAYLPALLAGAVFADPDHGHAHPATPTPGAISHGAGFGDCAAGATGDPAAGESIFRRNCTRCHTIGSGDHRAPDLLGIGSRRPRMWLTHWLEDSEYMATWNPYAMRLVSTWGYTMPDSDLDCSEIAAVADFLDVQSAAGPMAPAPPVALSDVDFASTSALYFDRCAGCHGAGRTGGIGPDIGPVRSTALGTDALASTIRLGLPGGMPSFGAFGIVGEPEIARLAAFLQLPVPTPPPLPMATIRQSWSLVVPPEARPVAPQHGRDFLNYFGVVLRDSGQIAIFDGDAHAEIGRVDAGFATHILRASLSGRLMYSVGRDGWVTAIDLYAEPPRTVARVRGCHDARSIEVSKADGYADRYLIQGCYAPAQYVVYDGATLEPLARIDLALGDAPSDTPALRVGAIAASPHAPVWVMALKEAGEVGIVDYALPGFSLVRRITVGMALHDGGWDHTHHYFLAAAPMSNAVVAIDVARQAVAGVVPAGDKPHPGRGANWEDPEFGWVNATSHLGEGKLIVYGADPVGRPEHAWRVVREVALPGAGGLFIKTHPRSPWVMVDSPMSTDAGAARRICAYAKATGKIDRCLDAGSGGRAVHFEFNRQGTQLWVAVWDVAGEVVIYDAATLQEVNRIRGLTTPTGKFNVFNTAHDVY